MVDVDGGADFLSIDAALGDAAVVSGDVIEVNPGIYHESINFRGKNVTVRSTGGPDVTTINGTEYYAVQFVQNETSDAVLDGFTVTRTTVSGRGIQIGEAYLASDDTVIVVGAYPTINNCIITNHNVSGIGIIDTSSETVTITNTTISGNQSATGGAMDIRSNEAPIFVNMVNCMTNCMVTRNISRAKYSGYGGGMYLWNTNLTLMNCTVAGNISGGSSSGGGIYAIVDSGYYPTPQIIITNSIIWGNSSSLVTTRQIYMSGGYGSIDHSDFIDAQVSSALGRGAGNIELDPLYVDSSNADYLLRDYHITDCSPCIDVGTATGAPVDDIDGDPRPLDGDDDGAADHDMGADEVYFDADGDGFLSCEGDCDSNDPEVYPGAPEVCNGRDNDCDGDIDEDFTDADGDGYAFCVDCDDANQGINPGVDEICDGIDNNCNDVVDEGPDADGDGYTSCNSVDCNDYDPSIYPGADEICDGEDNNCDGEVDEGFDEDGDGVSTCTGDCDDTNPDINWLAPEQCNGIDENCSGHVADEYEDLDGDGYTPCGGDCFDAYPGQGTNPELINPDATEICDGIDNNCDGTIDEGCATTTYYRDADGDTYGDPNDSVFAMDQPEGYVENADDCDDTDAAVNPGATEICNGIDDNCDGLVDEGFDADGDGFTTCADDCDDTNAAVNPGATEICNGFDDNCDGEIDEGCTTYYRDADGDTYGDADNSIVGTSPPSGYVSNAGDCDDADAAVNPGATEICNGIDDNCDGNIDEGCATYYQDADGDGYGNPEVSEVATSPPAGYVTNADDCDDTNAAVNPGATEICNGIDDNCDGKIDEGFDADGDGFTTCAGDCDDTNAAVNPGATEICNGIDDDCDGEIDEGFDADGDGFTTCAGDCDDANAAVNPGATEICNGIDDNCDGAVDEDNVCSSNDTTPPTITISVNPGTLWPPNHKMVPIGVVVVVQDDMDPNPSWELVSITMDESDESTTYEPLYDDTPGDGNTINDIQVDSAGNISLRSERSGKGDGRTYTIVYKATDASGNTITASATVTVPHSM